MAKQVRLSLSDDAYTYLKRRSTASRRTMSNELIVILETLAQHEGTENDPTTTQLQPNRVRKTVIG